jgi:hypothetical protein
MGKSRLRKAAEDRRARGKARAQRQAIGEGGKTGALLRTKRRQVWDGTRTSASGPVEKKPCSKEQGDHHFSANCQAPWRFLAVEPNGSAALSCDSGSTARPLDAEPELKLPKVKATPG